MTGHTVLVDGLALPFTPGQTVAGAMVAAGRVSWRTTRGARRPRGIFCGIGICFDCLVTIDDTPNQRACLVLAQEGQRICTQEGTGHER